MSKNKVLLLTLLTVISITTIVGSVWAVKHMIIMKNGITDDYLLGDKAVEAFNFNDNLKVNAQLSNIEQQVDRSQKRINDFATANIEYNFIENTEAVNEELITKWLIVEEDGVVLDEVKVRAYVDELAKKYNTVGTKRLFVDSHGKTVTVSGGPYGWEIDCNKETKELVDLIKKGINVAGREPIYKQRAMTRGINDIGNTYVEINMSEQKMWYYKEGELIVSTNIVTGNTNRGNGTPTVVGYIYNKARNINLVGEGYVAFVHYWMKVYGSIGIHDASWRNKFGGTIYTTNGSHGCINTPYDMVKMIYENIEIGTPVVIFYEENNE